MGDHRLLYRCSCLQFCLGRGQLFASVIEQHTVQQYQRNKHGAVLCCITVPAAGGNIMQYGNDDECE